MHEEREREGERERDRDRDRDRERESCDRCGTSLALDDDSLLPEINKYYISIPWKSSRPLKPNSLPWNC